MHVRRTQDFGEHKTTCMQPAEFGLCVGIGYFQKASKRLKVSHKHWSWDLRMFINHVLWLKNRQRRFANGSLIFFHKFKKSKKHI